MTNKIRLERTVTKEEPSIYITASNALSGHINKADYVCDGVEDEYQVMEAVDKYHDEGLGGGILLSEGQFNFTTDEVTLYDYLSIHGAGRGATKIVQSAENKSIFNAKANRYTIEDLYLQMPTINAGDTITWSKYNQETEVGKDVTGAIIRNMVVQGGTAESSHIRVTDAFSATIENITGQGSVGGVLRFDHVRSYYYGNGKVSQITCSPKSDSTGIYLDGNNNLLTFTGINLVTGLNTGNGIKAIHSNGCNGCTWEMIDLEGVDYAVYFEDASNHTFNLLYSTAKNTDIYLDSESGGNTFINQKNGVNSWKIVDNGPRQLSRLNKFISTNKYIYEIPPITFSDDFIGVVLMPCWNNVGSVSVANSKANITTGTATGNSARIDFNGNGGYKDLYESYMEFKANRVSTGDYDVYLGLANTAFAPNNHAAYFRALSTDENWQMCVSGASCTPTYTPPYTKDTGVPVDTSPHTFKIHRNSLSQGVEFYIDNVWLGDLRHCMPLTTIEREPIFEIVTQEDAAKSLSIDYVLLQQGRALTP